jgi:hypothetical protein
MANHNLRIEDYTLDDLLGLFEIRSYDISMEDLKRAKKRVLMSHPDKSRLPPNYFLFYKKAFDIVIQFYENRNKQNQKMNEETVKYKPLNTADLDKNTTNQITKVIGSMKKDEFQSKFNQLFESNEMVSRPDPKRNEWFKKDEADYKVPDGVSAKNMGQAFDKMKEQSSALSRYRGVQTMISSSAAGNFYDDQDDNDAYVTSDPFSKLKFDDLRKVHKDQTVLPVSESDFEKVQTFKSVDEFNRERSRHSYEPIEKSQAQKVLDEQEKQMKEKMMRREYEANLKSQRFAEKNKSVLSTFLQLGN